MRSFELAAAAVVAGANLVAAQNATAYTGPGPYPQAQNSSADFQNADQQGSKSVPFSLYWPTPENAPTWTWTTSIEAASIPNSDIPNAQQLNTKYSFSWGDGNLRQAVARNSGQLNQQNFCVTVLESLLPDGTTNDYDPSTEENAADGSCEKPLREKCLSGIAEAWRKAPVAANGCRGTDLDLSKVHQCQWSFEGSYRARTYNLLSNATAGLAANNTFPIPSGGGFAHITSDAFDGSNRTFFDVADTRLHMVVIDSGTTFTPLCMRVNTNVKFSNAATGLGANLWMIGALGSAALAYVL